MLVLSAGINSCIGNLLLKKSRLALPDGAGPFEQFSSMWFLGGMFFYAINVVLFAKALDGAPVSVAYPILATSGFALLAVSSNIVFGERLTLTQGAGLVAAVVGIALLARGV